MRVSLIMTTALLAGCLSTRPEVTVLAPPCPTAGPPVQQEFVEPSDPHDSRTYPLAHGVNRARHETHREALEAWSEVRRSECPGV